MGSFQSEPALMLLQISGIILTSSLIQKRSDLVEALQQAWRPLLAANTQHVIDKAIVALLMDESLVGISPGKVQRTSRQLETMAAFEQLGISRDVEYADPEDLENLLGTPLAKILTHVSIGHFEEVFTFAWLTPEATRQGATAKTELLTPRLAELIDRLGHALSTDADHPQAHNETESGNDS